MTDSIEHPFQLGVKVAVYGGLHDRWNVRDATVSKVHKGGKFSLNLGSEKYKAWRSDLSGLWRGTEVVPAGFMLASRAVEQWNDEVALKVEKGIRAYYFRQAIEVLGRVTNDEAGSASKSDITAILEIAGRLTAGRTQS